MVDNLNNNITGNYGLLYSEHNIKLHRKWFKQMAELVGMKFLYYAPVDATKHFDINGELKTKYKEPIEVFGIFDSHPDQKTLRKMGWVAELDESSSIVHLPYDLEGLQAGGLLVVPSGVDNAPSRKFRIIMMSNIMVYPASISCEIALEYEDQTQMAEDKDFTNSNFNKLLDNEDDD